MMNNRGRLLGAGLVALMLSGWEVASLAGWLNPFLFPPVHAILVGLAESLLDGRLVAAVTASLARGGAGYLIAALAGIGLGTLAGYHPVVRQAIEPIVDLVRPLPSPASTPPARPPPRGHPLPRHRRRDEDLHRGVGVLLPHPAQHHGWGARGADAARRDRTQSGA